MSSGTKFTDSELIIGLVGAVGTELKKVIGILSERLKKFDYDAKEIRVSSDIISLMPDQGASYKEDDEYDRIDTLMTAGNKAREFSGDNSVLALGAAAKISEGRLEDDPLRKRTVYIINSLKRPEEVTRLRDIYSEGFFLIGIYSSESRRFDYLSEDKDIDSENAKKLIERDADEDTKFGQRTRDTFHLSDFFIYLNDNNDEIKSSIWRVLDICFGHPYTTPTFNEWAMFIAFSAALRSADLSRQVGAAITKNDQILATGSNDCPKYGGGLYWPEYNNSNHKIEDIGKGRDYTRGEDSNDIEKEKIINDIINQLRPLGVDEGKLLEAINKTKIDDITEYGRVVHAEMDALLSCARNNISSKGATLYCTTFPCHNCAKHIIAAGIKRVVYVEPYPKSKAAKFHDDSIALDFSRERGGKKKVYFEPFVGVGPRRFLDLFSMKLGSGYPLIRKEKSGKIVKWVMKQANLRIPMLPTSYLERETLAADLFLKYQKGARDEQKES